MQGKRRDSPGLRNGVAPPKNMQRGEASSRASPQEVPALLYSCVIIIPQSAEENCFHKQGFYALKKLEHEHLIRFNASALQLEEDSQRKRRACCV